MTDSLFENIILEFMLTNYPVTKIKYKNRFKQGIILDDGVTYLLHTENTQLIKEKLKETSQNSKF